MEERSWLDDKCTCGHTRADHQRCGMCLLYYFAPECRCESFDLDPVTN